ncbi:sigma-E factor negative regulatory protein [Thiolinea disciformis]|uniref:sigma-E factor negative regulatory protein n=1 Tax=Thiolinea disciformis TaxID=125614 RepID=UPI0003709151|nr:sigma-E factor negative regulatory protein [Thiolinea disciformis]
MNTSKHEFLSALLDDEVGSFEQRRLLDELKQDHELGQAFSRYALIGEAMRSKKTIVAKRSLLDGIHAELYDEPALKVEPIKLPAAKESAAARAAVKRAPIWRYAMAASAVLALVGGIWVIQQQNNAQQQATLAQVPATPTVKPAVIKGEPQPALAASTVRESNKDQQIANNRLDPQTREMIKMYMAQHVKYASTTAIVPSVRAVSNSDDY